MLIHNRHLWSGKYIRAVCLSAHQLQDSNFRLYHYLMSMEGLCTEPPVHIDKLFSKLNTGSTFWSYGNCECDRTGYTLSRSRRECVRSWILIIDGRWPHAPVMPLLDVFGNAGTVPPAHIVSVVPKLNAGVTLGLTVTFNINGNAHNPDVGVNVYDPEFWLSIVAGLHVPLMPLFELPGKFGTLLPAQMEMVVPKLNVGGIFGFTVTVNVTEGAHCPAAGVNV